MRAETRLNLDIMKALMQGIRSADNMSRMYAMRMLGHQITQSMRRSLSDTIVPAALMFSVTSRCNLRCKGCYHNAKGQTGQELTDDELDGLVHGMRRLGTSIFVFAGGEPMMRWPALSKTMRNNPESIHLMFTNGTMIDDAIAKEIASIPNLLTVISIEADDSSMEDVRGKGCSEKVMEAMNRLQHNGCFFGNSIVVRHDNISEAMNGDFLDSLQAKGSRFLSFVEYVPLSPGTEAICLHEDDRSILKRRLSELRAKRDMVILSFPGDEDRYNGCLAAGRGFLHVSSSGNLEACPAAPFSDMNVRDSDLRTVLGSPLMSELREMHDQLKESEGGCALWSNKELVQDRMRIMDNRFQKGNDLKALINVSFDVIE